ncbi:unnamed protein product [Toxocara canis]|uniref:Rho-GAP domain-containing protein n=1 Tax=Toxocara canis TaxID=6265 RepID=A0A183TYY2_TOXCA|nr:unnamed protein product [Toxocara canis]
MSGIPSRPIPPPRAPRNCKPPIPKRPDRIRATSGNLPFISQPRSTAVNNGMNEAADAAEATDGTNSCSTTRLAPIVESPDKVASLATLQPPRPIPRYSPTSPPVPQKPKRLSSYCSEGLTSTSSGCSATQLVAPKSDSTELIHALDSANDSQFAVVRSASPLPPPKPLRFSMTPSNDSTNSLNSLPSPASLQRTSSASSNDYSTPSDVLPESLNRSTFASRHRDDRSPSAEKSPTFTEPCPNLLSKGNSCFSCDSSNSPDEPTLPLPKIRHYATSSTSTDEPTGSVLDEVVRHESSSINIYPDLNATTSATTPSLKLIDFSSESEMSIPVKNGQSNGTENEAHDGTQCRLSPTIATKSHYANLPLVHDSVGSKESCHCIGPPEVHPPSPPPPPIPPQHYGLMRSIVDKQDEKKQQLPGLEVGPNGGIWNPGYIGLENYRKLVEASQTYMPINRSAINVEVSATSSSMCEMSEADMEPQEPIVNELVGQLESNAEEVAEGEAICFSGYVHLMFNKKDRGRLWAVLRSNRLTFHQSEDQVDSVQHGPYEAGMIIYVGCSPHSRSVINICLKENALCLHWNYLKLTAEEECSNHWVLLLAKCVMPKDDTLTYSVRNVDAAGRVWIRQGATCPWSKGWMHLDNRRLLYILDNCAMLFELDVRKFIAMKTEVAKVDWCASVVGSQKGPFLLTQDGSSLYVQGECDSVTTLWAEVISSEMECTGSKLEDHKLTADDVPIIVDKCIKFISTYGLYQPGLYRRNGSTVEARLLMED